MQTAQRLGYDLSQITKVYGLEVVKNAPELKTWLSGTFELTELEQQLLDKLYIEVEEDGGYWNEEELKVQFVGQLFRIADVTVPKRIKVFYERPLSATLNGYVLSVVTDCLIAAPLPFNTPDVPYFFLQEFKKKRGEKKTDPSDRQRPKC
jgi:hypothetical protein